MALITQTLIHSRLLAPTDKFIRIWVPAFNNQVTRAFLRLP
jgi:hypothetical protein